MSLPPKEVRRIVATAPVYKMSLGKSAAYEAEALQRGSLLFQSEARLHDAVMSGDEEQIANAGMLVKSENHPMGNAPPNAWGVWVGNIRTFMNLEPRVIVLHWESKHDRLYWGITDDSAPEFLREEASMQDQRGYFFERKLIGGWRRRSVNGLELSNIHPKAKDLAINQATINLVQTDPDFFRALLQDRSLEEWTSRPDWKAIAKKSGWHPKPVELLKSAQRERLVTPLVEQIADDFQEDIKRMADTALKTVQYANGQSVLTTVKKKETDLSREELEEEIGFLLVEQGHRCALTDYDFKRPNNNKHLLPSLDRKDSSVGYFSGNLQVVTRAANFFKSASDDDDWRDKAEAMERMAIAIQKKRKQAQ